MTPEELKTFQQLKRLEVQVYRGLHLNAANTESDTNRSVIDQWIKTHPHSLTNLEKVLNHIHIYDFFLSMQDEAELERLANEIAQSWEKVLSGLDPRYRVERYEGYGPEVTFYFDRGVPDTG